MSTDEDDLDPVVVSYDIYIKPHLNDGKNIYILQFPNRDSKQNYSRANHSLPLDLRVKDKSGLVEIDVPVDTYRNYDREKGVKWGEAVRKSDKLKGGEGGTHGLAGGFGIGGGNAARPRAAEEEAQGEESTQEALIRDWTASVAQGKVLAKQTLGGQAIPKDNATPRYMIGAFRKHELHLTPVDHIVQMRPQFHHIDAQTDLERGRTRDVASTRVGEPRAIHMTVKPTADGEEETTDTMAERIRALQEEPWRKLNYVDEDSEQAWEAYNEHLLVENIGDVPRLESSMSPEEYMDTISIPRAPARLAKLAKLRTKA